MYQQYLANLKCIFVALIRDHCKGILFYIKQLNFLNEIKLINRYIFLLESEYITSRLQQEILAYINDRSALIPKPCVNC